MFSEKQFILVNKAKPLAKRLINELLPEISADLPADLHPAKNSQRDLQHPQS